MSEKIVQLNEEVIKGQLSGFFFSDCFGCKLPTFGG